MSLRVCYGGSFDPVHDGHLAVARAVRDALAAEVWFVPAGDPPHKARLHADGRQRARMLALAIAGEPGLHVDPRELGRAGPSYTIDTLQALRAELGLASPLAWLVGGDALLTLDTWHRWRALFDVAHVLAVDRPGAAATLGALAARAPRVHAEIAARARAPDALAGSPSGGFARLALPRLRAESSTTVRALLAGGGDWRALVPAGVAEHIDMQGLYGAGPGGSRPL